MSTLKELPIGYPISYIMSHDNKCDGWVVSEKDSDGYQKIIYETDTDYYSHSIKTSETKPLGKTVTVGVYYNEGGVHMEGWQVDNLKEQLISHEKYRAEIGIMKGITFTLSYI